MINECQYRVRLLGQPKNLKVLIDRIKSKDSKTFVDLDYSMLFDSYEPSFEWEHNTNVFSEIEYFDEDDFCEISGISEQTPLDGLWEKISFDYSLKIELEFTIASLNVAGTLSWDCGVLNHNLMSTYWQFIYENDIDLFWEKISKSSTYHKISEIIEILGYTYDSLSDTEKEKVNEIHKRQYLGL